MSNLQLPQSLIQPLNFIRSYVQANPLTTGATALALILIRRTVQDYKAWLDLGRGGAPYNFLGYIMIQIARVWGSSDLKSTDCYKPQLASSKRYLKDLPVRQGVSPLVSTWIGPVRQLNSHATKERIKAC
jgi:hypothetical protein